MSALLRLTAIVPVLVLTAAARAQTPQAAGAPLKITLQEALSRARQYATVIQNANIAAALAHEDRAQTNAARLPSLNALNQFIYTEGNGTPSGVFVANDGVHVYNEQAVVHEDILSLFRRAEVRRALAAEAIAKARVEIAQRGLNLTVIQDYYAVILAQRKLANAQTSLRETDEVVDIMEKQEKGGEAAHADVIKGQIVEEQHRRDLEDSEFGVEKAKIALGVLIFPELRSDYAVEDDLDQPVLLPPFPEAQSKAVSSSPDLQAARYSLLEAGHESAIARYGYLPSLSVDFFYGIDANQFAAQSSNVPDTGRSTAPNYTVAERQNLGYSGEVTLNVPVWDWGAIRSKVKQADLRKQQAQLDLTLAQRTLRANVETAYREAQTAREQLDSLRKSVNLSAESLRLTLLRYESADATALELVDAQATLAGARNAYDDGLVRYRTAIANLQSLTGN